MIKLNFILLLTLVGSGLFLVYVQHENRLLFTAISHETRWQTELKTEKKQLLLEQQNLATPTRIAGDAKSILHMTSPDLGVTEFIPQDPQERRVFEAQIPVGVYLTEQGDGHE